MTLAELVNNNIAKLSPIDLDIWRYILAHKQECCYISIYDLGKACNVSRTTILRFAKKLNFDGFSDMKLTLKMENTQTREQPTIDIAKATLELCEKVGAEIAKQDFTRANQLLYQAKRVFVYSSGYLQRNIANEIIRCFINAELYIFEIRGQDEFRNILNNAAPDDLFIFVSLSGESVPVVDFARELHLRQIPFIAITQLKINTLAGLANENFYITPQELPALLDTTYRSMLGFFLLIEIWFVSYTRYLGEQLDDTLDEEQAIR